MSDVIEIALPSKGLGQQVQFVVLVERELNGTREVVQRIPDGQPISLDVPASDFDARHWRA